MSKFVVTAPVLALAATAVPVHAQEMPWTGFYVGAHAASVDSSPTWTGTNVYQTVIDGGEGSFTIVPHTDTITASPSHSEIGGGARVGFNFQTGTVVLGGEADATLFGYTATRTAAAPAASYTLRSHATNLETVRARAGFAFDKVMIFATGGVALSNLKHTLTATDMSQVVVGGSSVGPATATLADRSKSDTGWTAGGGGEVRLSDKFSIALTLLHVDFGKKTLADASAPSSISARIDSKMFVGMLGINLGF
jgi:outer membrane immunogenic protein